METGLQKQNGIISEAELQSILVAGAHHTYQLGRCKRITFCWWHLKKWDLKWGVQKMEPEMRNPKTEREMGNKKLDLNRRFQKMGLKLGIQKMGPESGLLKEMGSQLGNPKVLSEIATPKKWDPK